MYMITYMDNELKRRTTAHPLPLELPQMVITIGTGQSKGLASHRFEALRICSTPLLGWQGVWRVW